MGLGEAEGGSITVQGGELPSKFESYEIYPSRQKGDASLKKPAFFLKSVSICSRWPQGKMAILVLILDMIGSLASLATFELGSKG